MKRRCISLALPLVLAVTAACGSDGKSAAAIGQAGLAGRGPNEAPAPAAPVVGTYPLTGMPATDAVKLRRSAVAVKIDNNAQARPQAGLEAADVIFEEFTEGITRFVVVFQSADALQVGPVRSVRPGDPDIVKPFGGPLVFSGGSPAGLAVVRSAGITQVTENDRATLQRRSGKRAPHNLFSTTSAMFAKAGGTAPPAFSTFLAPGARSTAAGGTEVTQLRLSAAPGVVASYDWDAGASVWKRSTDGRPHVLEGGAQLSPRNVIVQYTPYASFPADQKVRFPEVVGSGDAVVFVGSVQVRARWSKASAGAMTTFTDSAGRPIPIAPGQTWVHLQAPGSPVSAS